MFLVTLLILAGITALIVWLVYRPNEPKFRVVSAAVYDLNTTTPPFLFANMQFTLITRNPNKRVSFYYDRLSAFVSYRNQAITPPTMLPPLYQETKSTVALSPVLGGAGVPVPVSPEVSNGLGMDEAYGAVPLRLILTGRIKYKAGSIRTDHHDIYVECDMLVGLKKGFTAGPVPLLGVGVGVGSPPIDCKVDA